MNDYEIRLPYHKQGCDLAHCIETSSSLDAAFALHIQMLLDAVERLINIRSVIASKQGVEIFADNHFISISGPANVMNELLEKGLVELSEGDGDDDDPDAVET